MFLIAKIVRGRRLLHELEKQEKDEHLADAAAQSASQTTKRGGKDSTSPDNDSRGEPSQSKPKRRSSSRAVRKKTGPTGSVDSSVVLDDGNSTRKSSSMPSIYDLQQASSSVPVRHYNYDGKLNKLQKRAIRFTWHRLQTRNGGKRVENVFEEVLEKLVKVLPNIRDMFSTRMFLCAMSRGQTSSLRDHSKLTVKMIDCVVKNLDVEKNKRTDTESECDPRVIGRKHSALKPYGLTGNYWEKFGEIMIDVVLAQEAVRDLPGAGQAWVIFTACLVDQLRAGFDESRRIDHDTFMRKNTVLHQATQNLNLEKVNKKNQTIVYPTSNTSNQETNGESSGISSECPFHQMSLTQQSQPEEIHSENDSSETIYL